MALSALEALAKSALLRGMPANSLERLASAARRRTFRRGEVIFHEGDPGDALHVLSSGRVKVSITGESGHEAVFSILTPGDCFGELSLIDGGERSATVEALEPVETVALRRADFMEVVRKDPETLDRLLVALSAKIRHISEVVGDLAFLDLEGRLAKRLLELAAEHGRSTDGEILIELPITQEDLAAMIGATRTSVNKLLGWYEDQGAIRHEGRQIVVIDPERLRRRVT